MLECCQLPQKHHAAIYDKYTDKRFKRASHFVETEVQKGFRVVDPATNNAEVFASLYSEKSTWGRI
jgi:hypothetical protein